MGWKINWIRGWDGRRGIQEKGGSGVGGT